MTNKGLFGLILIVFLILLAAGCGPADEAAPAEVYGSGEEALEVKHDGEGEDAAETASVVVVTDQMGREVALEETPLRLISLSPSNTEIIFALGLGDRLVGVTEFCNYPPEAQEKDIVGGFATPSIEIIVELEPDLVLASTIHAEEVPRLEELGIAVMVIESSKLLDLYTSMSLVAEVTGVIAEGEALIASMQERINAVEEALAAIDPADRVLVYYEVYSDPLMSAGAGAFINEIITLAGGVNIFGDVAENYPTVSAEVVAEKGPEIILYPDYHGTAAFVIDAMIGRPGWESVPAVQEERVYAVSDDAFARPGPRVVNAVEEAARLFYPDLF